MSSQLYLPPTYSSVGAQPASAILDALAGMGTGTGLVEQTGAATVAKRALGVGAGTSSPTRADADSRYDAAGLSAAAQAAAIAATPAINSGSTTRAAASSTGTEEVAHGLGKIPKAIRFLVLSDAGPDTYSEGWSRGTASHTCHRHATVALDLPAGATSINCQVAGAGWTGTVSVVDATNFTISWTKVGAGLAVTCQWLAIG